MSNDVSVLLADSDHAIRKFAQLSLEETGCRVQTTDSINGMREALSGVGVFRVLVTEAFFPDGNLFGHIDDIVAAHPDIAVVVMSPRQVFARQAQQKGFGYLHKPFAGDDLVKTVHQAARSAPKAVASLAESAHLHVEELLSRHNGSATSASDILAGIHGRVISEVEKPLIEIILRHAGGNQLRAAKMLGLNRNTLRKKIRLLGIDVRKPARPGNGKEGKQHG